MSSDDGIKGFLFGMGFTIILFLVVGLIMENPIKTTNEVEYPNIQYPSLEDTILKTPALQEKINPPEEVIIYVVEGNDTNETDNDQSFNK